MVNKLISIFTCRIQSGENIQTRYVFNPNSSIVLELEFQNIHTDCTDTQECQGFDPDPVQGNDSRC